MYADRIPLLQAIEARRNSRAILFVTGDRKGLETQIHPEAYDHFVNLLDDIGVVEKISLILYTRGGNTLAGWSIVNLIKQFGEKFEVIVPSKAYSCGTLMCLGAQTIVMTKQATLGPIDPSITTPLNPAIPGAPPNARVPVSVEAVNGFVEFARQSLNTEDASEVRHLLVQLCNHIHPLVLGSVFRSKSQIEMLGRKLMESAGAPQEKIVSVLPFLCSESGSHDYSIHRREALKLGLPIEKPDAAFYLEIKALYDDLAAELEFATPWNPMAALGTNQSLNYSAKRCLVESTTGGSYSFVTQGHLEKTTLPNHQTQIQDTRQHEGWNYDSVP